MKSFDLWNSLKKKIHNRAPGPRIKPREVWWCSLGVNVGSEIDGKNDSCERPVLILKKLSQEMAYVLPITSKIKDVYYHKKISGGFFEQAVVLNQGRAIDTRRLFRKVHILKHEEFESLVDAFIDQYKYEIRREADFSGPEGMNTISVPDRNSLSKKLDVPYYSQFIDIQDPFWMLRACGATSLKMALEYEGVTAPDLLTLCNEARDCGGYDMNNGWVHDYLVTKANELGAHAYRKEGLTDTASLVTHIDAKHPVIVSVEKRVLEQKRFHMILLVGYEVIDGVTTFIYHEPESTDKVKGAYRRVDEKTFLEYWRGKAIFVGRL